MRRSDVAGVEVAHAVDGKGDAEGVDVRAHMAVTGRETVEFASGFACKWSTGAAAFVACEDEQ